MKKLLYLLSIVLLPFISSASHVLGGAITWRCLANGQYVFEMEMYRDCTGINWTFQNETIDIVGAPLPIDSGGSTVNSIVLQPDILRLRNSNNGDTSPDCTPYTDSSLSCANGDPGAVQIFYYKSSPITLAGTPPASGWKFFWEAPCCRPNDMDNVNSNGQMLLRAIMYPDSNGQSANPCFDSSPSFQAYPAALFNRGHDLSSNQASVDADLDSLVYSWSRSYNPPQSNPQALSYYFGFSPTTPLPGTNSDVRNNSGVLNQETGLLELGVFSGYSIRKYITVVQVDAYRNGILNASIFREIPIVILNGSLLPNSKQNLPPNILIGQNVTNEAKISVVAGQFITVPVSIVDGDMANSQKLTTTMNGSLFSQDFTAIGPCQNQANSSCAYLENSSPILDTIHGVSTYSIEGIGQVNTMFKWQTDCSLLGPNGEAKTYYFYFNAHDNVCPVPASGAAVISVTVEPTIQSIKPNIDCVVNDSQGNEIYWSLDLVAIPSFQGIDIFRSTSINGTYTQLGNTITDSTITSYKDLVSSGTYFYYLKVKAADCNQNIGTSLSSDTLTNPDNKLIVNNIPSCFNISWNTQKRSYQTKYLIYREYPLGLGFRLIDSVYNESEYCDPLTACNDSVNYYVRMENGGNCSFNFSTQKVMGNNALMNNGIREINHVLSANVGYGRFQWYDCNKQSIILDSVSQTFVPRDTGSYAVILYQYGCVDTSNCILYFPVGLSENNFQNQVTYFPNPTSGLININLANQENVLVQIRNIQGQLVQEQQFKNKSNLEIDIECKAGVYFIQMRNEKGETANLKVVKQ